LSGNLYAATYTATYNRSLDFTDDVYESYKNTSMQAAQALDVKITGLDMMIDDITAPATTENYAIIEMDFNPAIHIHCHPYKGGTCIWIVRF